MEHLLKPEKLNVLSEEPDAAKIYNYWLKANERFLAAIEQATDKKEYIDCLAMLTNFLSPPTFSST